MTENLQKYSAVHRFARLKSYTNLPSNQPSRSHALAPRSLLPLPSSSLARLPSSSRLRRRQPTATSLVLEGGAKGRAVRAHQGYYEITLQPNPKHSFLADYHRSADRSRPQILVILRHPESLNKRRVVVGAAGSESVKKIRVFFRNARHQLTLICELKFAIHELKMLILLI